MASVKTHQWSRPSHNHSSSQANKQHCGFIDDGLFRPIHWREAMIGGEAHPRQKDGSFPKEAGQSARQRCM